LQAYAPEFNPIEYLWFRCATLLYDGENHYTGNILWNGTTLQVPTNADGYQQQLTYQVGTNYLVWDEENIVNRLNSSKATDMLFTQYPANGAVSYPCITEA
jgi:hypothetical protein